MSSIVRDTILRATTSVVELIGLWDSIDKAYVVGASVSFKIFDDEDRTTTLQASTGMSDVLGSAGDYLGIIPATLDLSAYDLVYVEVVATYSGSTRTWFAPTRVKDGDD